MEIFYSEAVEKCHYTIKCIPDSNYRQRISNIKMEMYPESKPEWGSDSHGNKYIFGCNWNAHSYFKFRITGDAEYSGSPYDAEVLDNELMIYRHHHGMNMPGVNLKGYFHEISHTINDFDKLTPLKKALSIMERLNSDFSYEKGCTNVKTDAEEAFRLGKGVCQDYAHILTSLLIMGGCAARYVTGLILGEGESHAWVEVADNGKWYGIDPTNNTRVEDKHIKIGVGRDASECEINRGIMHGGGNQIQKINVIVVKKEICRNYYNFLEE